METLSENASSKECPETCITTEYTVTSIQEPVDELSFQQIRKSFGPKWLEYMSNESSFHYTEWSNGPLDSTKFENNMMVTSLVHVNFVKPKATVTIKDAKVTFADMLGNIGGTFGVFLGLSFVGVLDFIILVWGSFKQAVMSKKKSQKLF